MWQNYPADQIDPISLTHFFESFLPASSVTTNGDTLQQVTPLGQLTSCRNAGPERQRNTVVPMIFIQSPPIILGPSCITVKFLAGIA